MTVDAQIIWEVKFANTNHLHNVLNSFCQLYKATIICLDEYWWFCTVFNVDLFGFMDVVKYHLFEITEINDICVISCWTVDAHIIWEVYSCRACLGMEGRKYHGYLAEYIGTRKVTCGSLGI